MKVTTVALGCLWPFVRCSVTIAKIMPFTFINEISLFPTTPISLGRQGFLVLAPLSPLLLAAFLTSTTSGISSNYKFALTLFSVLRKSLVLSLVVRTGLLRSMVVSFTWILVRSIWISWDMVFTLLWILVSFHLCILSMLRISLILFMMSFKQFMSVSH